MKKTAQQLQPHPLSPYEEQQPQFSKRFFLNSTEESHMHMEHEGFYFLGELFLYETG